MNVPQLSDADVAGLVAMPEAIDALERAFAAQAAGAAGTLERTRVAWDGGRLQALGGFVAAEGFAGVKAWTVAGRAGHPVVLLFSTQDGALQAIVEARELGRLRTGAASGLATRLLAREDAATLALIGTGRQATAQAAAVVAVRPIERIRVAGRDAVKAAAFAAQLQQQLGVACEAVADVAEAVRGADVVTTITNAEQPLLSVADLAPGTHVNAAGAILPATRELDASVFAAAERIVVDAVQQAAREAGDLRDAIDAGLPLERLTELADAVAQPQRTRPADTITVFKSVGVGLEDVAVAALAWRRAAAAAS